jgi:asparagine synthase (glutamine-hydrolysing)
MGYVAGIVSKLDDNVQTHLFRMLDHSSMNIGDSYGVSSKQGTLIERSRKKIRGLKSRSMLGYKFTKITPTDVPQPLSQRGYSFIAEGRIWNNPDQSVMRFAKLLKYSPREDLERIIRSVNGSYVIAILDENKLICGRDPVGVVPLYYGENEGNIAVASNMKMLQSIGLEAKTFPPGNTAEITMKGISFEPVKTIRQPETIKFSEEEAVNKLDELLRESVEKRSKGLLSASLGFSGGIDSSLVAYYLKRCGLQVDLICIGSKDSTEFKYAESSADFLDLPIKLETFTSEEIESELNNVLYSVEEANPVKIGIATPLYFVAKKASENGNKIIFSGNGSDELFGGYRRHLKRIIDDENSLREMLLKDVLSSHKINYERDYKICSDLSLELRLPFTDFKIVNFGLSLPSNLKIALNKEHKRKYVLRKLARKIGFPKEISERPKKAIQYSTGANKILKKLATMKKKSLNIFLEERLKNIKEKR